MKNISFIIIVVIVGLTAIIAKNENFLKQDHNNNDTMYANEDDGMNLPPMEGDTGETDSDSQLFPGVEFKDECLVLEGCKSYMVNKHFINYGCAECEDGYTLDVDDFGSGICIEELQIENCSQEQFDEMSKKRTCIMCKEGFIVSQDGLKCEKMDASLLKVENCRYMSLLQKEARCLRCEKGFTLSEDNKSCTKNCSMANCESCMMKDKKNFCSKCELGFIGISEFEEHQGLSQCLSCKEWFANLMTDALKTESS
jgi:hypothetical protein